MQCQDILELLSPYLDGALDAAEKETVRSHLDCCPSCRTEWEELNLSVSMLQELPEILPPAGFRSGLMEKIDQLSAPQTQDKHWFSRVAGVTRKTWYRTAAVAAVMAMSLGLTSLWEVANNQLVPIDQKPQDVAVVVQENHSNKTQVNQEASPKVTPSDQTAKPEDQVVAVNQQKASTEGTPSSSTASSSQGTQEIKAVENYVPQKSEGLVARSVSLKLHVADFTAALKSIGATIQSNRGSLEVPYAEKNGTGSLAVRVAADATDAVVNELQQLGSVVSLVPVNQDLSTQHQQLKDSIDQLGAKKLDLENRLKAGDNAELQKELATVNAALAEKVNLIQQLENRSTYTIITITLV